MLGDARRTWCRPWLTKFLARSDMERRCSGLRLPPPPLLMYMLSLGRSPTGVDGERGDERTHAELSAIDEDAAKHDSACPVRPGGRARWAPRGDRTRRSTPPYAGGAGSRASTSAPFGGGSPLPSADRIHAERGHSKHPRSEPHVGRAAADHGVGVARPPREVTPLGSARLQTAATSTCPSGT